MFRRLNPDATEKINSFHFSLQSHLVKGLCNFKHNILSIKHITCTLFNTCVKEQMTNVYVLFMFCFIDILYDCT